jgi:hypothetical protein
MICLGSMAVGCAEGREQAPSVETVTATGTSDEPQSRPLLHQGFREGAVWNVRVCGVGEGG